MAIKTLHYSEGDAYAALCVWEHLLRLHRLPDSDFEKPPGLDALWENVGTDAMRDHALVLGCNLEAAYCSKPPSAWYNWTFNSDIVRAFVGTIRWERVIPVVPSANDEGNADAIIENLGRKIIPAATSSHHINGDIQTPEPEVRT